MIIVPLVLIVFLSCYNVSSNIAAMRAQLDRLGCQFDWSKVSRVSVEGA